MSDSTTPRGEGHPFMASWADLPTLVHGPNNFRVAAIGKELGVNRIRWEHPVELERHAHEDAEQAVVMIEGEIELTVGDVTFVAGPDHVVIIPRGVEHSGRTIGVNATFIEVFAPARVENLAGFLGVPGVLIVEEGE